jgi:prepilin-type N-terminal cleavage/methylation domain-containing protein
MNILTKMKMTRLTDKIQKTLRASSRGFTLIEVLIALALFTIIAFVFAGGLSTASKAVLTADVRTRAESLARTQMESIKEQGYNSTYSKISIPGVTGAAGPYYICSCNSTGSVNCTASRIIAVVWNSTTNNATTSETGLQKITLVIKHGGTDATTSREVTRLEGYKRNREA